MNILTQNFVFEALASERDGSQFPIDFDLVWAYLKYSTKGNAKRALTKGLVEGEDYLIISDNPDNHAGLSVQEIGSKAVEEKIYLSVDGFKHFCLMARTEEGRHTRRYFIDTEKPTAPNLNANSKHHPASRTTPATASHSGKCIKIAVSKTPTMCEM